MADETLNKLLKAHGINDDTAVLLADQGFVTEEAISVLTIGDIPSLKIKQLAQRRLLEKMINKLEHVANSQDAPDISRTKDNDTTTSSSLSLDETVKQLIATASSSTATRPQHQVTMPGTDLSSLGINNVCNSIRGISTLSYI